jgi:hypothetical protein
MKAFISPANSRQNVVAAAVQKYGVEKPASPLPQGIHRGHKHNCFMNATRRAFDNPDRFIYCEGFGFAAGDFPIAHAWCLDRTNDLAVVDAIWSNGTRYYGIPFKLDFLSRAVLGTGVFGILSNIDLPEDPTLFLADLEG